MIVSPPFINGQIVYAHAMFIANQGEFSRNRKSNITNFIQDRSLTAHSNVSLESDASRFWLLTFPFRAI